MTDFQLAPSEKDICKIHSSKSNKHLSRICTSKLTKEELEDLYYEIFENNIELKRVVNQQKQAINGLNTKVLRMTATRRSPMNNPCCADSRVIIKEQKEMIQELKFANEKLVEKMRQLKVQLCSKKQFTKTSPGQKSRNRPSYTTTNNSSVKNKESDSSVIIHFNNSSAQNKESETSLIVEVPQEQHDEKDVASSSGNDNNSTKDEQTSPETLCNENKCNTQMDELKEKISNLVEELNTSQKNYNTRIAVLEEEIGRLSKEEQVSRAARAASQAALTHRQEEAKKLAMALKTMETHTNQLTTQLQMEKMKVTDLEMQLKTTRMSNNMFDIIEEYFNKRMSKSKSEEHTNIQDVVQEHERVYRVEQETADGDHNFILPHSSPKRCSVVEESLVKANENLSKKVIELEGELDKLKVFKAGQEVSVPKKETYYDFEDEFVNEDPDVEFNTTIDHQTNTDEHDQVITVNEYTSPRLEESSKSSKPDSREKNSSKADNISTGEKNNGENRINNTDKHSPRVMTHTIEEDQSRVRGTGNSRGNSQPNTYTVKREPSEMKKSPSPQNTDLDVSSITDVSSPRSPRDSRGLTRSLDASPRSPTEPLSLGENRNLSSITEYTFSSTEQNTSDKSIGYLSDGEIPSGVAGNFILSCEWAEMKEQYKYETLVKPLQESKAVKMKAALQQIKEHLMKCRQLQASTEIVLQNSNEHN